MTFGETLEKMQIVLSSSGVLHDLAVSAFKMLDPSKIGKDNRAWLEGPVIESPAKMPPIRHDHPYVLKTGNFNRYIASLLHGDLDKQASRDPALSRTAPIQLTPEVYIAHSAIMQFHSLLEEYEFDQVRLCLKARIAEIDTERFSLKQILETGMEVVIESRINYLASTYARRSVTKRLAEWESFSLKLLPDNVISKYAELSDYRNRLAHEPLSKNVNMQKAIDCYYFAALIAERMSKSFGDAPAEPFRHLFRLFGESETEDPFLIKHQF